MSRANSPIEALLRRIEELEREKERLLTLLEKQTTQFEHLGEQMIRLIDLLRGHE